MRAPVLKDKVWLLNKAKDDPKTCKCNDDASEPSNEVGFAP
jgi:hypothetical protein